MIKYSHGPYVMLTLPGGKRILEHRYKMELKLKRRLKKNEVVHHKDENGKNNSLSNLQVMTPQQHAHHHKYKGGEKMLVLKCPQCKVTFSKRKAKVLFDKKNKTKSFCSRQCSGKFNSDKYWK